MAAYTSLVDQKDSNLTIKIKEMSGNTHDFPFSGMDTIGDLRKTLEAKLDAPATRQRLIWRGRELKEDSKTLGHVFKEEDSTTITVRVHKEFLAAV
eukprot:1346467-Amorphochlora_amoeboformis.AAC.2